MYVYVYIYIYTHVHITYTYAASSFASLNKAWVGIHGSFPTGFISNRARFSVGSSLIAFLPNDLPN